MKKRSKLLTFLIKANEQGYASGDWSMHDNFFGGEPYGRRLVVFYKKKPQWIMVYYGYVGEFVNLGGGVF